MSLRARMPHQTTIDIKTKTQSNLIKAIQVDYLKKNNCLPSYLVNKLQMI